MLELFAPSVLLVPGGSSFCSTRHPRCLQRRRKPQPVCAPVRVAVVKAVSVGQLAAEVVMLGVAVGSIYFFLIRDDDGVGAVDGKDGKDKKKKKEEVMGDGGMGLGSWGEGGVIGLRSVGVDDGDVGDKARDGDEGRKRERAGVRLKFGGNDVVNDFMEGGEELSIGEDDAEIRKAEELKWGGLQVMDLPSAEGCAVFDAQGEALSAMGSMIQRPQGNSEKGPLPKGRGIILNVQQEWGPFLRNFMNDVVDVMAENIGDTGAVVVACGREEDSFSDRDLRVLKAVASRLMYFIAVSGLAEETRELTMSEESQSAL